MVAAKTVFDTRPGLTPELVCLRSLFSSKTPYSLVVVIVVVVDTCTHWVPIFS